MKNLSKKNNLGSWLKRLLPLVIVLFAGAIAANAQTALEQQCFNLVQGKVAWDQAGSKNWGEGNIRNLCRGTTQPERTIECFRSKIAAGKIWDKASAECQPGMLTGNSSPVSNTPNFTGNWGGYYQDGRKSSYVWAISQSGTNLTFKDVGANTNTVFSGRIENGKIIDSNGAIGTLSADGTRINWSNTYYWVKQTASAVPTLVPTPAPNVSSGSTFPASLPGAAHDLDIGKNKVIWKIGTDPQPDGFGIYRLVGTNWRRVSGGAVRIAVDENGLPWIINERNEIYKLNYLINVGNETSIPGSWSRIPGTAVDIDIGDNGVVSIVDPSGQVSNWAGKVTGWVSPYPNPGAVKIAVDLLGKQWIINRQGNLMYVQGSQWRELVETRSGKPRPQVSIATGGNDSIWTINNTGGVREWTGKDYSGSRGSEQFKEIAVDGNSDGWAINLNGEIKKFDGYNPSPPVGAVNHYEQCLGLSEKRLIYRYAGAVGNKDLIETEKKLPTLCKGTTDYIKTVKCFETYMFALGDNDAAIQACAIQVQSNNQLFKFGSKDASGEITNGFIKSSLNESSSAIAFRLVLDSTSEQSPPFEKFNYAIEK